MSLRSRANYVAKITGQPVHFIEGRIKELGKDSADLAHVKGITLKEADLQLLQERFGVICAVCQKYYGIGESQTQGSGCASIVLEDPRDTTKKGVLCCYGSAFDCDYYEAVKELPVEFLLRDEKGRLPDAICDGCVKRLIDGGYLKKREGDYPWGPPWAGGF